VAIGGRLAPLLYADATQVLGLVPTDLPANTAQQVLVQRDSNLSVPTPIIIAATHPAVLTRDGSGQGQAMIYKAGASAVATTLADSSNPVRPGDTILVYCTGLGLTDAGGTASNAPSLSIGGLRAEVSYAGVASPKAYPPAGAPSLLGGLASSSLGGLYQITATVPSGVTNGAAGQSSQLGVTLAITGGLAGSVPAIASVNTAGGFPDIAQNDFIEIKGSNLAPASVGNGITWDGAPEFASGRMPAQLGGVSVTVDGKPAFVYFVSPGQLNVLTPLDGAIGPVQIVVTNGAVSSAPFTATLRNAAPSFLVFGSSKYIASRHADFTLQGPASFSAPGFAFTPAQSGETILLYAVGLGLPSTTLTNGSSSQSGALPRLPEIQIGGLPAVVAFAGVVAPGLYQLNVTVPSGVANGDNAVTFTYGSQTAPAALISVQR